MSDRPAQDRADLDKIAADFDAHLAAFNDMTKDGKAWCDPVAYSAIDCTQYIPALVAELRVARRQLDAVRARIAYWRENFKDSDLLMPRWVETDLEMALSSVPDPQEQP